MQTTKTAEHMMGRTQPGRVVDRDPWLEGLYESARPAFDTDDEMARILRIGAEELAAFREGTWRPGEEQVAFLRALVQILSDLHSFLTVPAARNFLHGNNIRLEGRPLDALLWGRREDVVDAVEALRAGTFA